MLAAGPFLSLIRLMRTYHPSLCFFLIAVEYIPERIQTFSFSNLQRKALKRNRGDVTRFQTKTTGIHNSLLFLKALSMFTQVTTRIFRTDKLSILSPGIMCQWDNPWLQRNMLLLTYMTGRWNIIRRHFSHVKRKKTRTLLAVGPFFMVHPVDVLSPITRRLFFPESRESVQVELMLL